MASGGLLGGGGALTLGATTNSGNLTSGVAELFLSATARGHHQQRHRQRDGCGVKPRLVKSGSNTWTLNGTNTYTGGTYVDQGTLTIGNAGNATTGLSILGTGGIFLNGGNLTQTAGGIIPAQAVTITGSSTLTTTSDL